MLEYLGFGMCFLVATYSTVKFFTVSNKYKKLITNNNKMLEIANSRLLEIVKIKNEYVLLEKVSKSRVEIIRQYSDKLHSVRKELFIVKNRKQKSQNLTSEVKTLPVKTVKLPSKKK